MIVNYIKKERIFSTKLPDKISGKYWIKDFSQQGDDYNLLSIEAIKGQWIIKSNQDVSLLGDNNEILERVHLEENSFLNVKINSSLDKAIIITHPLDENRQVFTKYLVVEGCALGIGRSSKNQIIHPNIYISGHHAKLTYNNNVWTVEDLDSTNGTYVNNERVTRRELKIGDVIYILGLEIIIGKQFLAINNPEEAVQINTPQLVPFVNQEAQQKEHVPVAKTFFYRSPRFKREISPLKLSIDAPPTPEKIDTVPLALMLGPSITMGMASMSTGAISVVNTMNSGGNMLNVLPTIIMAVSMLMGSILWPLLTKKHEKKLKLRAEKLRQEKYFKYLNEQKDKIKGAILEQKEILLENIISVAECRKRIEETDRRLWERMPIHNDFLQLRLGMGTLPLACDIKYPERKFIMQEDNLQNAMFMLGQEEKLLEQVPISISLVNDYKLGFVGNPKDYRALVKSLLLQTMALHSYDEVKIVLITRENDADNWEEFSYVPHIWNKGKSIRFFATNAEELKALSAYMEQEILGRLGGAQREEVIQIPYYVFVIADKQMADRSDVIGQLIEHRDGRMFSMLLLYDELRNLPKETTSVIEVNGNDGKIYDRNDITGNAGYFVPEYVDELKKTTQILADIQLDDSEENFVLPNMITFTELFGVGRIGYLNALQRWKDNNPALTLQTPIGLDTNGEVAYLDLHEKYHGPHGLVAGMTGSGKSEFIITYILSLAVNYHPDEVAFILIDYKGGGLAGAFLDEERGIKLPHLAGTITNLDGSAVKRSLISIQSELRRRQAIFNEARKTANAGTMDIYKYQTLYRNKVVTEPLPHLFIISDEFAELKSQQPEFMEQLISAARIGRSLGVHLILATQKPAGVVDDQIWSNSKFRVCLKVQDKADSMDMIKRPDAAELSQTGRYYLQVGFNEFFAMGQSAWCGADYIPADEVEQSLDYSVQLVDPLGRVVQEVKPKKVVSQDAPKTKQIVEIVKYLSGLAEEEKVSVRPLWLPAIPTRIMIDDLLVKYHVEKEQYKLNPIVGEYDDPFNQKQDVVRVNFTEMGNCLVYGASGNGKTTFLTSVVYSMLKNYHADEINLYLLDFGSETLKVFENAPQVGGVVLSSEEERIRNLVKMLTEEVEYRKKLFSDYGGDIASYLKNSGAVCPNVVVVINNYSGLTETYEDIEETLVNVLRDGTKYGIYFCVSVNGTNGIRYRASQNFAQVFTMQLNDETDYAVIMGKTEGVLPAKCKGRGLYKSDKVYEFQTAYSTSSEADAFNVLREFCIHLSKEAVSYAKEIPILPEVVTVDVLEKHMKSIGNLPVGIGKEKLDVCKVALFKDYIYIVSSQDRNTAYRTAAAMAQLCGVDKQNNVQIWDAERTLPDNLSNVQMVQGEFERRVVELFGEIVERNNVYKDSGMDIASLEKYGTKVIALCGLEKIFSILSADALDKFKVLLHRGQSIYKVHFILAEDTRMLNSVKSTEWYMSHVDGGSGIWIGDGFTDQYILKPTKHSSAFYQEIGDQFGYLLIKGKPVLIKVLTMKTEEE